MTNCVNRLIDKPPQTRRDAMTLFSYFASRLGEIGQHSVVKLGDARIVPVLAKSQSSKDLKYLTPRQCYLGNSPTYSEIFDFVDFGNDANAFLFKCGSKHEPSKLEIAALVAREPARLLGIMQSPEKYLNLLRTLADDLALLKRDKVLFSQLRASQFLLAWKEVAPAKESQSSRQVDDFDDADEAPMKQWQLAVPGQIVVVSFSFDMWITID